MRVVVDFDVCESNGVCVQTVPEVFDLGDDDLLDVLQPSPPEELEGKLREAAGRCPKQAITLVDDPTGEER
ncbi:MAG: subB [Frankiales bacterium]|nr:subB [Frankiales bacterium]